MVEGDRGFRGSQWDSFPLFYPSPFFGEIGTTLSCKRLFSLAKVEGAKRRGMERRVNPVPPHNQS